MGHVFIVSGTLRGRRIETPGGEQTRPLLARVRKSLADVLRPRLAGARVLDLFGGSGAVAFEFLSNGAQEAVVVELDAATAGLIGRNAAALGARAQVLCEDALRAIPKLSNAGERFDVIVVAPPYGRGLGQAALELLESNALLAQGGVVVVQRDRREPAARSGNRLNQGKTRVYGRTAFDFYEEADR